MDSKVISLLSLGTEKNMWCSLAFAESSIYIAYDTEFPTAFSLELHKEGNN